MGRSRFQIRSAAVWKGVQKIFPWLFLLVLVVCELKCTAHHNPFDPDNKQTKGKPFHLYPENYFGQIKLTWNRLPHSLKIDDYQIFRQGGNGGDTLFVTTDTSFQDMAVESKTVYSYRVSARRGGEASDSSDLVQGRAYWYPKT